MPPPYEDDVPDMAPFDSVAAPHTAPDRTIDIKEGAEAAFPKLWFRDAPDLAPAEEEEFGKVPLSALQLRSAPPPGKRQLRRTQPKFKPVPFVDQPSRRSELPPSRFKFETPEQIHERIHAKASKEFVEREAYLQKRAAGRKVPEKAVERTKVKDTQLLARAVEGKPLTPFAQQKIRPQETPRPPALEKPGKIRSIAGAAARPILEAIPTTIEGLATTLETSGGLASMVKPYTQGISSAVRGALPTEEGFAEDVAGALGSAVAFIGGGVLAKVAKLPTVLSTALMGVGLNVADTMREAEAMGLSPNRRNATIAMAAGGGLTELAGLGRVINKFGLGRTFARRMFEVAEEGGQEALQRWLGNINAAYVGAYDPNRPLSKDVAKSALLGAIVGGVVQGVDIGVGRLRGRGQAPIMGEVVPSPIGGAPGGAPLTVEGALVPSPQALRAAPDGAPDLAPLPLMLEPTPIEKALGPNPLAGRPPIDFPLTDLVKGRINTNMTMTDPITGLPLVNPRMTPTDTSPERWMREARQPKLSGSRVADDPYLQEIEALQQSALAKMGLENAPERALDIVNLYEESLTAPLPFKAKQYQQAWDAMNQLTSLEIGAMSEFGKQLADPQFPSRFMEEFEGPGVKDFQLIDTPQGQISTSETRSTSGFTEYGAEALTPTFTYRLPGPSSNYQEIAVRWQDPPEGVTFNQKDHYGKLPDVLFDIAVENRPIVGGGEGMLLIGTQSDWAQSRDQKASHPFRNQWLPKSIEYAINEASRRGVEGLLVPHTADQVAVIQKFGQLTERDGRFFNSSGYDITPIIKRYTKELPELLSKVAKKLGVTLETRQVESDRGVESLLYLPVPPQRDMSWLSDMIRQALAPTPGDKAGYKLNIPESPTESPALEIPDDVFDVAARPEANGYRVSLRGARGDIKLVREKAPELADEFEVQVKALTKEAEARGLNSIAVVRASKPEAYKEESIRHETFHVGQGKLLPPGEYKLTELHDAQWAASHPTLIKAVTSEFGQRVSAKFGEIPIQVMAYELPAYVNQGSPKGYEFGLTAAERLDYVLDYRDHLIDKWGPASADIIREVAKLRPGLEELFSIAGGESYAKGRIGGAFESGGYPARGIGPTWGDRPRSTRNLQGIEGGPSREAGERTGLGRGRDATVAERPGREGLLLEGEIDRIGVPRSLSLRDESRPQPPIVRYKRIAANVEASLPPVESGMTRLWRGDFPGSRGTRFTNDLPGIAMPFGEWYGGDLSYVDVPSNELTNYEQKVGVAPGAEFGLPEDLAIMATPVKVDWANEGGNVADFDPRSKDLTLEPDSYELEARRLAEDYGRDWDDMSGYEREVFIDEIRRIHDDLDIPEFSQPTEAELARRDQESLDAIRGEKDFTLDPIYTDQISYLLDQDPSLSPYAKKYVENLAAKPESITNESLRQLRGYVKPEIIDVLREMREVVANEPPSQGPPSRPTPGMEQDPIFEEPLYTQQVSNPINKELARAFIEALKTGGVKYDPTVPPFLQVTKAMMDGKLRPGDLDYILKSHNKTWDDFAQDYEATASDAGRTLNYLAQIQGRWSQLEKANPELAKRLKPALGRAKSVMRDIDNTILGRNLWERSGGLLQKMALTQLSTFATNTIMTMGQIPLFASYQGLGAWMKTMMEGKGSLSQNLRQANSDAVDSMAASFEVIRALNPRQLAQMLRGRKGSEYVEHKEIVTQLKKSFPELHRKMDALSYGQETLTEGSDQLKILQQIAPEIKDDAERKRVLNKIAKYEDRMNSNLKGFGKVVGTAEQIYDTLLLPMSWSEYLFRRPMFVGQLRLELGRQGVDLDSVLAGGSFSDLDYEAVQTAVNRALEFTYAYSPSEKGPGMEPAAASIIKGLNQLGPIGFFAGAGFPRAAYNGMKFVYEWSVVGGLAPGAKIFRHKYKPDPVTGEPVRINEPTQKDFDRLAKAMLGTFMFAMAWGILDEFGGPEWWQVETDKKSKDGRPIYNDIRKFKPISEYFRLADLAKRAHEGRLGDIDVNKQMLESITGFRSVEGQPEATDWYDAFKGTIEYWGGAEVEPETSMTMKGKEMIGRGIALPLTPLVNLRDLYAQFKESENVKLETRGEGWLGPSIDKLPWFRTRNLPQLTSPVEPSPIGIADQPGMAQFGGWKEVVGENFAGREWRRLGLANRTFLPRDPDPVINREQNRIFQMMINNYGEEFAKDPSYLNANDSEKAARWDDLVGGDDGLKAYVKAQAELSNLPEAMKREAQSQLPGRLQRKANPWMEDMLKDIRGGK